MYNNLGYTIPLYILPFDHRSSFVKNMFGIKGRQPTNDEKQKIIDAKQVIYEAFKKAVAQKIPKENAAILVDEEYGDAILRDARQNGFVTILTSEKSGQEEFDFEYGTDFPSHIEKYNPTFVKALIRYNPEGNKALNTRQKQRLKTLSNYCHSHKYKLLIEPLIPGTKTQLSKVNGDSDKYDQEIRPNLTVLMIRELQDYGIEVDVWKLEGMEKSEDYEKAVVQARNKGRDNVGVIILGRAAEKHQVERWLKAGSHLEGIIGFAVGRTIFWDPLVEYRDGKTDRQTAVNQVCDNFVHFYKLFTETI